MFQQDNVKVLQDIEEEETIKRDQLRQDQELESDCEDLKSDLSHFESVLFELDKKAFYKTPQGQHVWEQGREEREKQREFDRNTWMQ